MVQYGLPLKPSSIKNGDEETLITGPHLELPDQGGTTYYRCEDCGRESLRRGDLGRSEFHTEGCSLR